MGESMLNYSTLQQAYGEDLVQSIIEHEKVSKLARKTGIFFY